MFESLQGEGVAEGLWDWASAEVLEEGVVGGGVGEDGDALVVFGGCAEEGLS